MNESNQEAGTKRVPMGAYVDRGQHQRLVELAREHERSLSAEVRIALREHIERDESS
jgi:hypothetical protein